MKNKYLKTMLAAMSVAMIFFNDLVVVAAPEVIQIGDEYTVFDPDNYGRDWKRSNMDRDALVQHYITSGDYYDLSTVAYHPQTDVTELLEPFRQINEDAVKWTKIKLRTDGVIGSSSISVGAVSNGKRNGQSPSVYIPTPEEVEQANLRAAALLEAATAVKAGCSEMEIQPGIKEFMANVWAYTTSVKSHGSLIKYDVYYQIPTKIVTDNNISDYPLSVNFCDEKKISWANKACNDSIPGYEWRCIGIRIYEVGQVDDAAACFSASADNSKDWQYIEDSPYKDAYRFTIVQDGIEYPECKVVFDISDHGMYYGGIVSMLVPTGYTGNAYCHVYGATEENGQRVPDLSQRLTACFPNKSE